MPRVEVSIDIDAPAERVYALVADLPRMGEWSPETTQVRWRDGVTVPVVGARFRGYQRRGALRWWTDGLVTAADPGRELSWDVSALGLPVARWTYRFEPLGPGRCRVVESTEDRRGGLLHRFAGVTGMGDRAGINRANMALTLERLKAAAERHAG